MSIMGDNNEAEYVMAAGEHGEKISNRTANEYERRGIVNIENRSSDVEIDLIQLFSKLFSKMHYIVLFFIIGGLIFNLYSYLRMAPTYQSTAKMYIVSASSNSVVNLADLTVGATLTSDYEELIFSDPVMEQVIDTLKLGMTTSQLSGMISLANPEDTRLLNITVTSSEPKTAQKIANKVMDVAINYLPETMSTNPPNVAQKAKAATVKSGPNVTKYTLMGALFGAFLYCAYIFVMYIMDDTIHTAEELERTFGLTPLSIIPENEQLDDGKEVINKKKKKIFSKFKKGEK